MNFGKLVKDLRIKQRKTLRQFCQENGLDPSNWSKIERNINMPPRDEVVVGRWAESLGLKPDTEAWKDFIYQAQISRGNIPREVMSDEKLMMQLPVFLRTVRGAELTEKQLKDFIVKVREAHTPDNK